MTESRLDARVKRLRVMDTDTAAGDVLVSFTLQRDITIRNGGRIGNDVDLVTALGEGNTEPVCLGAYATL